VGEPPGGVGRGDRSQGGGDRVQDRPDARGVALLKTRWKTLRRIRVCPRRIGAITAAALVLTTAE
jgi:hypothetical protein